ncbi:hypothetical protein [Ilumatobacter sp.]|uniref:hypothetical protein n=1 Tax=Ilumatobacter sp. TaxID=1967498 RepID=UPI003B518899
MSGGGGIARMLRIVVVMGAGAGAWFGYDEHLADHELIAAAAGAEPAPPEAVGRPWPDDVDSGRARWSSWTSTVVRAGGNGSQRVEADARGRTRVSEIAPDGSVVSVSETDGEEIWTSSDGSWSPVADDDALAERVRLASVAPPSLDDVVVAEVWPYTDLVSDVPGDGEAARVLTVRIDVADLVASDPSLAARWRRDRALSGPDDAELAVGLDAHGRVVEVARTVPDGAVTTWSPLVGELTLSSPIGR